MPFDRIAVRYILPLLLVLLVLALCFEFSSVESIDLDTRYDSSNLQSRVTDQNSPVEDAFMDSLMLGDRFRSLSGLVNHQQTAGFVRVGLFGDTWPAKVVEIQIDQDSISFVRANGTRHNYTRFDGYTMKMVRLKQGGDETIVVFRSETIR